MFLALKVCSCDPRQHTLQASHGRYEERTSFIKLRQRNVLMKYLKNVQGTLPCKYRFQPVCDRRKLVGDDARLYFCGVKRSRTGEKAL
jgi:hypothetical protein